MLLFVIYLGRVFMWVTESCYGQLSVFGITQSAKCVESAEDILRVLGALVWRPSAFTALGQFRSHFETGAVLQPAFTGFFQLRYRRFTKGLSTASARTVVTATRTVIPAFFLLTGLLVLASHVIVFRTLWSPTTFPRFLVISCISTNYASRFIRKSVIILIFMRNFIISHSVLKSSW